MIKKILFTRNDMMLHGFDIMVRLYLLKVFFQSGLTKIQSWQSTIDLFSYEYSVPLLPPEIAAIMGAGGELILPVLLLAGLMTRPAAIGLFVLNAVAAYAYALTDFYNFTGMLDHILWGLMILVYVLYGPSPLSIDSLLSKKMNNSD
ncbi:MAG: DoxX family protein [gamma proteobacterium symbiont of Lucinoma myriamae]|nr:DoxX family protein [gamma proteobacterium symbiont of Lucinoma myriamae]MCU7817865.1 DoxX family protein [gamma proteobacterium symbiont of Lucinoma myriamae]MCU7833383.1 DoxX family protein [gamma proteobacterium symbiont of Lucinoma myriamae]